MVGTPAGWGAACIAVLVVSLGTSAPAAALEDPAHDEHSQVAPESEHAEHETAPAESEHAEHEPAETDSNTPHSGDHEAEPDTVSNGTRAGVLGGFGAANAAVLGGALVLRSRDRRTGKGTSHRQGNRR